MNKTIRKNTAYCFLAIIFALFLWGLVFGGNPVKNDIISAINRCLNIIIPSLFAFMTISDFLISTNLYKIFVKPFRLFSKYILKMPDELFFVFLLGNFAGYPVGIKLLGKMTECGRISKKTAEICSVFCCCGGPAFFMGVVGLSLFGNVKTGLGIFLSVVLSDFISAFFICRIVKPKAQNISSRISINSDSLTDSILNAGKGLFTICTTIVFFSAVISVCDYFGFFSLLNRIFPFDENIIKSFFELTFISNVKNPSYKMLPLAAALCSFGGICVMMQISAVNHKILNLKYFYLSRPVNAVLSALIFTLIQKHFIPDSVQAISVSKNILLNINNFSASICLILMILLLKYKKRVVFSK